MVAVRKRKVRLVTCQDRKMFHYYFNRLFFHVRGEYLVNIHMSILYLFPPVDRLPVDLLTGFWLLAPIFRYLMVKAVSYGRLFQKGCKQIFFCFQVSFCPIKRGNRAGSSRNESNYSRRDTQISFAFLESRSCDNFGLAHFSIV